MLANVQYEQLVVCMVIGLLLISSIIIGHAGHTEIVQLQGRVKLLDL